MFKGGQLEPILLGAAAIILLLQVVITMWRQQEHLTNAAHMRILGYAHSHRDLQDRMESVVAALQQELRPKSVSAIVYTGEHTAIKTSSRPHLHPHMSAKEARALDHDIHGLTATSKVPGRSHLSKLLRSYRVDYVLPLNHADQRVGYLFFESATAHMLQRWQLRIIRASHQDIAHALASALNTHIVHSRNSMLEQQVANSEHTQAYQGMQTITNARDEFVSMASHQLRTPLTSVKGYLSMVLEGDVGEITKEQRKLLSEAFLSSERMVRLISDFLNVSRIQTGKFIIDAAEFDMVKLIKQEIKQLQINAKARNITLKADVPSNQVMAMVDEPKIRQVVMNFIDNAIFYSSEKTTITIELTTTASNLTVKVIDQGIGVPLEEQPKLFEKFFRASNARMQRPDGTGVGLYLAKQIIDGHGGKLIFNSTPGHGSTFGFTIPQK